MERISGLILLACLLTLTACGGGSSIGTPDLVDTEAPRITSVTGISNGGIVTSTTVISAIAADDTGVADFTLRIDGATAASVPFSALTFTWDVTATAEGAHELQLSAADAAGNAGSKTFNVLVMHDDVPPDTTESSTEMLVLEGDFTLPEFPPESINPGDQALPRLLLMGFCDGDTVYGSVQLSVVAVDDTGVNVVTLLIDSNQIAINEGFSLNYIWDTTLYEDGEHFLTFVVRDDGGNVGQLELTLNVDNAAERIPPVLNVTGLTADPVTGLRHILVTATDESGIAGIGLTISPLINQREETPDLDSIVYECAGSKLEYTWDAQPLAGVHRDWGVYIVATDAHGNEASVDEWITLKAPRSAHGYVATPNGLYVANALVCLLPWGYNGSLDWLPVGSLSHAYTNEYGRFELEEVSPYMKKLVIVAGTRRLETEYPFPDDAGESFEIPVTATTFPALSPATHEVKATAVVAGRDDRIENCLECTNWSDLFEETPVTLFDGWNALSDDEYEDMPALFENDRLFDFHTLLIDSGNDFEEMLATDASVQAMLRAWIEDGGRLVCTAQAYDFVEQLYPQMVDFAGGEDGLGLGVQPEPLDVAQLGPDLRYENVQTMMRDPGAGWIPSDFGYWLASFGGFETQQEYEENVVPGEFFASSLTGFTYDWPLIERVHSDVVVWMKLNDSEYCADMADMPAMVSFYAGIGKVFVTSYCMGRSGYAGAGLQDFMLFSALYEVGYPSIWD